MREEISESIKSKPTYYPSPNLTLFMSDKTNDYNNNYTEKSVENIYHHLLLPLEVKAQLGESTT